MLAACGEAPARSQAPTGGLAGIFTEFKNSLAGSERPLSAFGRSLESLAELLGLLAGFAETWLDLDAALAFAEGFLAVFELLLTGFAAAFPGFAAAFAGFAAALSFVEGPRAGFEVLPAGFDEPFVALDEVLAVERVLAVFELLLAGFEATSADLEEALAVVEGLLPGFGVLWGMRSGVAARMAGGDYHAR